MNDFVVDLTLTQFLNNFKQVLLMTFRLYHGLR